MEVFLNQVVKLALERDSSISFNTESHKSLLVCIWLIIRDFKRFGFVHNVCIKSGFMIDEIEFRYYTGSIMAKALTYKPKKRKRKKKHGFLKRSESKAGKKVLTRRRRKSRKSLTV